MPSTNDDPTTWNPSAEAWGSESVPASADPYFPDPYYPDPYAQS